AQHDANLEFVAIAFRLDPAGHAGGRLAETNQFRRLLRARGARQGGEGHRLESIGLSLRVAAEGLAGGAVQRQVELRVIFKIEDGDVGEKQLGSYTSVVR